MDKSYFYPTQPEWFEQLLTEWTSSGKRTLSFPFLEHHPHTLPADYQVPFWMYLYFTKTKTEEPALSRVVRFRVRVITRSDSTIIGENVHARTDYAQNATVWFQCDLVEELRAVDGGYLRDSDFRHVDDVALLQAIRTSIAPVKRVSPMLVVQSTSCCFQD